MDLKGFPGGQWFRIHMPVQGTWVQAVVGPHAARQVSPGATTAKPEFQSPSAQLRSLDVATTEARHLLEPVLHDKRSHHNEKPAHCHEE